MLLVKMKKSETVQTGTGPVLFENGNTYNVEDWIGNSLVGRGFAELIQNTMQAVQIAKPVEEEELFEDKAGDKPLEDMNLGQLRELGKLHDIKDYRRLNKDELIAAIQQVTISAPQPASPFQKIDTTGGRKPPVHVR